MQARPSSPGGCADLNRGMAPCAKKIGGLGQIVRQPYFDTGIGEFRRSFGVL